MHWLWTSPLCRRALSTGLKEFLWWGLCSHAHVTVEISTSPKLLFLFLAKHNWAFWVCDVSYQWLGGKPKNSLAQVGQCSWVSGHFCFHCENGEHHQSFALPLLCLSSSTCAAWGPLTALVSCLVLRKTLSSFIFPQGLETWDCEPTAPSGKNITLAWNDNLASWVSLGVSYKILFQTCDCLLSASVLSVSNILPDPPCFHTSSKNVSLHSHLSLLLFPFPLPPPSPSQQLCVQMNLQILGLSLLLFVFYKLHSSKRVDYWRLLNINELQLFVKCRFCMFKSCFWEFSKSI